MIYLLKVKNLYSGYDSTNILKNINIEIENGKFIGLIGSNGSGKTTLIKTILGIINFNKGEILFNEKSINEDVMEFKKSIAYIPETPQLYGELTLLEHLELTAMTYSIDKRVFKDRLSILIKKFRMEDKLDHFPNTFSKGMKQKVMVMSAFLHEPDIFIVDEPFIGLDPLAIKNLLELLIKEKEKGKTIILSTHVLDTAHKYCDYFIMLNDGKVVESGELEAIKLRNNIKEEQLLDIYLTLIGEMYE